jgi:hypothetical protein
MSIHDHAKHVARARALWEEMNHDERNCVRFGIFPLDRMTRAEREGFDRHKLCLTLFDLAKTHTGVTSRSSALPPSRNGTL